MAVLKKCTAVRAVKIIQSTNNSNISMSSLSLTVRKYIRDAEAKRDANLATLKDLTGLAFTAVSKKKYLVSNIAL